MNSCVVIPARYSSSRFPGKPLIPLLGREMVLWVADLASQAVGHNHVYVATDDDKISKIVIEAGYKALMTSSEALTGCDRVAEAAHQLDYDIYINVQGDEPLVNPLDIRNCISLKQKNPDLVINGYCHLSPHEDPCSVNIPKVILNESGYMVYISRNPLPGFKDRQNAPLDYIKQVCIYGFNKNDLQLYAGFQRKSVLESFEDIEILRFFELNKKVFMFECSRGSIAVDIPSDVSKVEEALRLNRL